MKQYENVLFGDGVYAARTPPVLYAHVFGREYANASAFPAAEEAWCAIEPNDRHYTMGSIVLSVLYEPVS